MKCGVLRWGGVLVALVFLIWLGLGLWIWTLNTVPDPPRMERHLPPGNVYPRYVALVTQIRDQRVLTALQRSRARSGPEVEEALRDNEKILEELPRLAGKPSVVTELKPAARFVGALAFPGVTRLAAVSVRHDLASNPQRAVDTFVAALYFATGVMRGGATLHVTTGFLSAVPLFEVAPELIPRLNAAQCRRAAQAIQIMDRAVTPAAGILRAERVVRLEQLAMTVRPGATRIFRLDIPRESYDWQFLRKPKRPAYEALDAYMNHWIAQAGKPVSAIQPPPPLTALEGILADESLEPRAMGVHLVRHAYIVARLRLIHAALCLEEARKKSGMYPARLDQCVPPEMLTDPFSGASLIYRRKGSGYALYSVGPNGQDDGGLPYTESRMDPRTAGDLPLTPTF